jgi:Flp pilus assembly pilin Flp
MTRAAKTVLRRLRLDRAGDDLVEYVLLGSFVALVGVIGFQLIGTNLNTVYRSWDSSVQDQWETPNPASSGM